MKYMLQTVVTTGTNVFNSITELENFLSLLTGVSENRLAIETHLTELRNQGILASSTNEIEGSMWKVTKIFHTPEDRTDYIMWAEGMQMTDEQLSNLGWRHVMLNFQTEITSDRWNEIVQENQTLQT